MANESATEAAERVSPHRQVWESRQPEFVLEPPGGDPWIGGPTMPGKCRRSAAVTRWNALNHPRLTTWAQRLRCSAAPSLRKASRKWDGLWSGHSWPICSA